MGIAAQLDCFQIPRNVAHVAQLDVRVDIRDVVAVRREYGEIAIVEVDDRAGVREHCGGIRGNEELALTDAEQDRRALSRHHHFSGLVGGEHRQAVRSHHGADRCGDPLFQRRPGSILDQVGQRFGVGVGAEAMTGALQCGAQGIGVLDDAVVHDGDSLATVDVGMGVAGGRRAVGGPTRVRDAARPDHRRARQFLFQGADAAGELAHLDPTTVLHGDTRRIVAAIFQSPETLDENRCRLPPADVAYDAAHRSGRIRQQHFAGLPFGVLIAHFVAFQRIRVIAVCRVRAAAADATPLPSSLRACDP